MLPENFEALLAGRFGPTTLPDYPSKVIRIYLACTASDTVEERTALMQRVYPKLRDYCRREYGLEFQVVDPKWGGPEEWEDDSEERMLCFRQITECQNLSVGPNFIALVSQNYGQAHLASRIPADHFELLRQTLRHHRNRETRDAPLLDLWYKKDSNAIPPTYILQPVERVQADHELHCKFQKFIMGEQDKAFDWIETRSALKRLIRQGLDFCVLEGTITHSDAEIYLISDVDKEIQQGILHSLDPQNTCAVFVRNILDLTNYVDNPLVTKFIQRRYNELTEKWEVDPDCEKMLSRMKQEHISQSLPDENIHAYSILWKFDNGINPEIHKEYLNKLCTEFEETTHLLLDKLTHSQFRSHLPSPIDEILQHWIFAKSRWQTFIGREELLEVLHSYIVSGEEKPLVLYGETGSGKTSLMAKAAMQITEWIGGEVLTLIRFIGFTPSSFDICQVLHSLSLQLSHLLRKEKDKIPHRFEDLQSYFCNLIDELPADKNLVIFLDSLELLLPQYNAYRMQWLPTQLKENVKIIVSTDFHTHNILERLQNEVIMDTNNFVQVPDMTEDECVQMLDTLLHRDNRCFSNEQESFLRSFLHSGALPLHIKLLFRDVRCWNSYSEVSSTFLPRDALESTRILFNHLEIKYGQQYVSRSLAYLTASITGLSDCEMEDILSLDDTVLNEVFRQGRQSIRRIPPFLWLRLRDDIRDFITRKECGGATVYFWEHRHFVDFVKDRYLRDDSTRRDIHSILADYFLGTWHGKQKPYRRLSSSSNNNEVAESADRLVTHQPLTFCSSDWVTLYNQRKFDQVPRQLFLSGRLRELNETVYFSYEWLYNKTKALSLEQVLADFVLNPGTEATLVERALRDAQPIITRDISNLAAELTGRLLSYYNTHSHIRNLLNECDALGPTHNSLVPTFPYHQVPGSPLKYIIECKGKPTHFGLCGEQSRYILAKELNSPTVEVFDLATSEHKADITTSVGALHVTPDGRYLIIVDHTTEKSLKVHDAQTGDFLGQLIPMNQVQMKPKDKYKLGSICLSNSHVCILATTDTSYLCVADIESCKFLQVIGLDGRANVCQLTPDSRYVWCNSNDSLLAYDLITLQKVNNTTTEQTPKRLLFNKDASQCFMLCDERSKIYAMTLKDGHVEYTYKTQLEEYIYFDAITTLRMSNSEEMLMAGGNNNIIVYQISSEKVLCKFKRPMDVPKEFKLPNSTYRDISFTSMDFSPDDAFVIATIFRNVYIWDIANNRLLTSLKAPVGIISEMFIPCDRGQLVTHLEDSGVIHVWSLGDAVADVGMLDRLTKPVDRIVVTNSGNKAFVGCKESDEIGVFDMQSGQLIDLLTHESDVVQFSITPNGDYVFVTVRDAKPNTINKIWHTRERRIIYEFGSVSAYGIPLQSENTIMTVFQDNKALKAPYTISQLKLGNGTFDEYKFQDPIAYVLDDPFVTPEDRYLVVLSADDYDECNAHFENPTLCALSLKPGTAMEMATYSANDLKDRVRIKRILHARPYKNNSYTVVVIFTNESDLVEPKRRSKGYEHCFGFMIFDLCSGALCQVIDNFMAPSTPIDRVLFTKDVSLCIDNQSNVFNMATGFFVKSLNGQDAPPRRLALDGKAVVYYKDNYLFVVRLSDEKCIGHVDAHGHISAVEVCLDARTIVVGCTDGTIASYVIIDEAYDNKTAILSQIASRTSSLKTIKDTSIVRSWDKIGYDNAPPYSRPPSALRFGPSDKELLRNIKPLIRNGPESDPSLYLNQRSKSCVVM